MIARHACLRTFVDTHTRRKVLRSCSVVPRGLLFYFVVVLVGVVTAALAMSQADLRALPKKSPDARQGVRGFREMRRSPLTFRSGLLRLVAVVEGEQRLPSTAEMLGPEGVERMRPSWRQERWRCERLDPLISKAKEVRPQRRLGVQRPEVDKDVKAAEVRIAGLHEIGPVGLHIGRERRLRRGKRRAEVEDVLKFGSVLRSRREA